MSLNLEQRLPRQYDLSVLQLMMRDIDKALLQRLENWTPTLTFATPGDLNVVYSTRVGLFVKLGRLVFAQFNIQTSTFTHTTAAGGCLITGLPAVSNNVPSGDWRGPLIFMGITKAGYTNIVCTTAAGTRDIQFLASGSGVGFAGISAVDMPTGGSVRLAGNVIYAAEA